MKNNWKFLDGDTLKIIAIVTMLIDHIGAALIETVLFQGGTGISYRWYEVDTVLRAIGRTAFPIFVFLLVEGFFHTHSRRNYFGRLALFSLLAELPFDLAFHGVLFYRDSQNVFWTLAIGFLVIWGVEKLYERCGTGYFIAACILSAALISAGCFAAEVLRTDYGGYGILLIVLFYFGRRFGVPRLLICIGGYLLFLWEPYCIGGFFLILFYNGARKKRGRGFQYFFYLFYPVHLLILGLIRVVFFSG